MRLLAAASACASGSLRNSDQRPQPRIEGRAARPGGLPARVEHLRRDLEARAALHVVGAQALDHVVVHLAGAVLRRWNGQRCQRLVDERLQVEVEPTLDRGTQQAQAARRRPNGFAGPRRLLAGGIDAGDGVELVAIATAMPARVAATRRRRSAAGIALAAPRTPRRARRRAARSSGPSGPGSSGNSPTMAVMRSHFASSAARSARRGSPPIAAGDRPRQSAHRARSCRAASRAASGTSRGAGRRGARRGAAGGRSTRRTPRPTGEAARPARCPRRSAPRRCFRGWPP